MSGPSLSDNVPFDGCIFIRPFPNITNWSPSQFTVTVKMVSIPHYSNVYSVRRDYRFKLFIM